MKIGVIVDSHGKSLKEGVDHLNSEGVDIVLVNGDLQGYGNRSNLENSLLELSESNSDVYVIPGSHEDRVDYNKAMVEITKEFDHIINKGKGMSVTELDGDTILLSYGGATWSHTENPYSINPLIDVSHLAVVLEKNKDKDIIVQMHEPPKFYGDVAQFLELREKRYPLSSLENHPDFDKIKQFVRKEHVGDINLTMLLEEKLVDKVPRLVTFGHIHESNKNLSPGQEIPTRRDVAIEEEVSNLSLNPGPYMEGNLAVVEKRDENISYNIERV